MTSKGRDRSNYVMVAAGNGNGVVGVGEGRSGQFTGRSG